MNVPGCDCDACRADLASYRRKLERAALAAKRMLDAGDEEGVRTIVEAMAVIVRNRRLIGEQPRQRLQ